MATFQTIAAVIAPSKRDVLARKARRPNVCGRKPVEIDTIDVVKEEGVWPMTLKNRSTKGIDLALSYNSATYGLESFIETTDSSEKGSDSE